MSNEEKLKFETQSLATELLELPGKIFDDELLLLEREKEKIKLTEQMLALERKIEREVLNAKNEDGKPQFSNAQTRQNEIFVRKQTDKEYAPLSDKKAALEEEISKLKLQISFKTHRSHALHTVLRFLTAHIDPKGEKN